MTDSDPPPDHQGEEPVDTALLLAGGYGTRLGLGTKAMIEFRSRPLVDYTLAELAIAGVKNLVALTRSELADRVAELALTHDFVNVFVGASDRKDATTLVPYLLRRHLGARPFFFVVAHTPPPGEHLVEMRKLHQQTGGPVVSLYEGPRLSPKYTMVTVDAQTSRLARATSPAVEGLQQLYVESPLIVTQVILDAVGRELDLALETRRIECLGLATDEQFEEIGQTVRWIDELIIDQSNTRGLIAQMPPEFDYEADYQVFLEYMRSRYA